MFPVVELAPVHITVSRGTDGSRRSGQYPVRGGDQGRGHFLAAILPKDKVAFKIFTGIEDEIRAAVCRIVRIDEVVIPEGTGLDVRGGVVSTCSPRRSEK